MFSIFRVTKNEKFGEKKERKNKRKFVYIWAYRMIFARIMIMKKNIEDKIEIHLAESTQSNFFCIIVIYRFCVRLCEK